MHEHYTLNFETMTMAPAVEVEHPEERNSDWCKGGHEQTFGGYPSDGECSCGMYKHHVHCGTCGGVSQVG